MDEGADISPEQKRTKRRYTRKRLQHYVGIHKRTLIGALLLLSVAVAAELTGPFIAKHLIDTNILGIEQAWIPTAENDDAVHYDDQWYTRIDRLPEEMNDPDMDRVGNMGVGNTENAAVSDSHIDRAERLLDGAVYIIQVGLNYYLIDEPLHFEGERTAQNNTLIVERGEERMEYEARHLSSSEVFRFYAPEIPRMFMLIGLYIGLLVFASFFQYGKTYLLQKSANDIIRHMRRDVFAHIQRLPIRYFDQRPTGNIVARVTNDTEAVRELFVSVLATFVSSAIYFIGIFTALFILDVRLAFICLGILPILVVWMVLYRRIASPINHTIRARVSDLNGYLNESIQGMSIIRLFRRQQATNNEFERINDDHYQHQRKLLTLDALTGFNLSDILHNIVFVILIWYFGGASLGIGAVISIGVLYAFVDYINRLFQPINEVVGKFSQLEQSMVASERVFTLLDEPADTGVDTHSARRTIRQTNDDRRTTKPPTNNGRNEASQQSNSNQTATPTPPNERSVDTEIQGHIRFEHVTFGYEEKTPVLHDIHFEAQPGETVALVGHTGSGKSSIMNVLLRFYDVQDGRITLDGQDIRSMPKAALRAQMAIVLQDPYLFTGTIASNVHLDQAHISREKVVQALRDVGAERFISRFAKKYDHPVSEKGESLSAGERQLISFARALAADPKILILDEATANIDTETERLIQDALRIVEQGRTTFVIAHRLSTIRHADRILVLDQGRITESGTHESLMEARGRYYQMVQLQQGAQTETVV